MKRSTLTVFASTLCLILFCSSADASARRRNRRRRRGLRTPSSLEYQQKLPKLLAVIESASIAWDLINGVQEAYMQHMQGNETDIDAFLEESDLCLQRVLNSNMEREAAVRRYLRKNTNDQRLVRILPFYTHNPESFALAIQDMDEPAQ